MTICLIHSILKGRFMKNTLMIALLLAAPLATQAMESVEDPLESLKGICNVKDDAALARHVRSKISGVEKVEDATLIKALQHLSKENKLPEVRSALAPAPNRAAVGAEAAQDENAGDRNGSALQATIAILQGVVAVLDHPNVQNAENELAKAGCKNCVIL